MECEAASWVSTVHRPCRKDWKAWKHPDNDRAAAGCMDQGARLATNRSKEFPRALARDEWNERRLKMLEGSDSGCEPQRGCDLQPRVAASATLGTRLVEFQPQGGCADFDSQRRWRNRFAVE